MLTDVRRSNNREWRTPTLLSGTWVTEYSDGINRYPCPRNGPPPPLLTGPQLKLRWAKPETGDVALMQPFEFR